MSEFISIPENLDLSMLEQKFGPAAVSFYLDRLAQREREGHVYYNPLKTVYIWASADKRTNQGFWSSYRGYSRGRKARNFGRS